ncbi:WD40/YVTN/BNR-like repeat-containing protein [Actinomycetospora rhizophila]|uniref:WD40/YVTN/BNR-like repeat-containing protein n=1 Tax=Actinomycetospora rhizophila TaxID=1416876 RepID=A0ABV9ZNK0_9PSEU
MGFAQIREILDDAIGGPEATIGVHGPFWRDVTRDEFVTATVRGRPLLVVGAGAASNLVKSLKGGAPFGADLPEPPAGASLNRMPSGLAPVSAESVAVIEAWIDDGCPDDMPAAPRIWRPTNAPVSSARTDDIWFADAREGWAVNSDGQVVHTTDGFATWEEQLHLPDVWLRCIGFASRTRGWVGTTTPNDRLYETVDGGTTWTPVATLPPTAPSAICGLSVVDATTVYASGTNYPNRPTRMMRTVDGVSWQGWEMSEHADLLVDTYFTDADHGWVVGGKAEVSNPTRADVRAVVLRTEDGGRTWVDRLAPIAAELPLGEWGWKIQFLDDRVGFVALENFDDAAILKTADGGQTWERIEVNDPQGNANLEGIGFLDETTGWVGGWGDRFFTGGFSSGTTDGGATWHDANEIGAFINRFRFVGDEPQIGYASGLTVYRYAAEPLPEPPVPTVSAEPALKLLDDNAPARAEAPLHVAVTIPEDASRLVVDVWDRFGEHRRRLLEQNRPPSGRRDVEWDATDEHGAAVGGAIVLRVSVDGRSESQILHIDR